MLEHGGNLNEIAHRFGRRPEDWLDLSTGINPAWYPAPQLSAAQWHRLPEPCPRLIQAAQTYYGAEHLLPVAGTQAAIQALPRLRSASRVVVAAPSYAEHAHHWSRYQHTVRQAAYEQLDALVGTCDVMVVCNPNNPTGARVAPAQLLNWSEQLRARGGWLVVDEAFADMTPETSVAKWSCNPGLIVLRSVGKFFGLAGLRLGFVAAHPDLLTQLEGLLGPWAISSAAQQIGSAALNDVAWQAATRIELRRSAARMQALLSKYGILASGTDLFQWWAEPQAEAVWQHMAEQGILVRCFKQAGRGIRAGLPPDEAGWQRLGACAAELSRLQ